jgi:3-dehydroquinate synthetase
MHSKIEFCKISNLQKKIKDIDSDLILLIADLNVWGIYSKIIPLLEIEGKKVIFWKAPDGEKVKSMENLNSAVEFFLSKGVHRKAHVVSLGGGATSDFSGMVASVLLRGLKWSVIPTTLLSMVDAGIGGKVAVNSAHGKNLIGAFHHPDNIWICDEFLETLPKEEYQSGLGEVLKYGYLSSEINEQIINGNEIKKIIHSCVLFKESIVKDDFKENGKRKILNYGHTIGHAIEQVYSLSHGIAVAWGIIIVTKLFQKIDNSSELQKMIESLGVELGNSPWLNKTFPISEIMEYVKKDKKSTSNTDMDFILCDEIGKATIKKISFSEIENKFKEKSDELRKLTI